MFNVSCSMLNFQRSMRYNQNEPSKATLMNMFHTYKTCRLKSDSLENHNKNNMCPKNLAAWVCFTQKNSFFSSDW